ncbi:NADPH-dependent 1-acyl dihydroxyacetone phosphate reductase [Marasmius sp. AFHP31]|nr:NADPH-dependent 1-acyl dihydroxyacetone phosphate reductase [Marasmius sp. AFHP31]
MPHHRSEEFARRGCKVYATARNVSKLSELSASIQHLQLDVTSDSSISSAIQAILQNDGRIDILINNAGTIAAGALLDKTNDEVHNAFDTNTFSVLRMCRAVVPSMAEKKSGLIVNVSSVTERMPTPWNGLYCATKSAVRAISDVLEMECKPLGIQIMNVAPGSVKSNISNNQLEGFQIPQDSLWKAYLPSMIRRINASQTQRSMDTAVFARRVVDRILEKRRGVVQVRGNVVSHIIEGGNSFLFKLFFVTPRSWLLRLMWRVYGKTE